MDRKGRILDQQVEMVQMSSIFKYVLDCKNPSIIFLVFLKEQWWLFRLKIIKENITYNLGTPKDFWEMC